MLTLKPNPLFDAEPVRTASATLSVLHHDHITAIGPFSGQDAAIKTALGAWPAPGAVADTKLGRLAWAGFEQAFLFGQFESEAAACVDISDGWVFFALEGADAPRVMERLVPMDMRPQSLRENQSLRTQLGHLSALILTTKQGYEIGVMSSFAKSAFDEMAHVMNALS